jgi:hypothetical protein
MRAAENVIVGPTVAIEFFPLALTGINEVQYPAHQRLLFSFGREACRHLHFVTHIFFFDLLNFDLLLKPADSAIGVPTHNQPPECGPSAEPCFVRSPVSATPALLNAQAPS